MFTVADKSPDYLAFTGVKGGAGSREVCSRSCDDRGRERTRNHRASLRTLSATLPASLANRVRPQLRLCSRFSPQSDTIRFDLSAISSATAR